MLIPSTTGRCALAAIADASVSLRATVWTLRAIVRHLIRIPSATGRCTLAAIADASVSLRATVW
eukprot:462042-Prorocentrum_minimum.AAC.2